MPRTTTSDRFATGARIGDYEVEREIAYEEASVIYLATHVVLPRKAYVKVTHPGSRSSAVHLLREACILEALSHAGIPRVHECGVLSDRRPWCAIEVLPGVRLSRVLSEGRMPLADLVVALRDIADILHHVHQRVRDPPA
jgi:serine/threonine protein kinase